MKKLYNCFLSLRFLFVMLTVMVGVCCSNAGTYYLWYGNNNSNPSAATCLGSATGDTEVSWTIEGDYVTSGINKYFGVGTNGTSYSSMSGMMLDVNEGYVCESLCSTVVFQQYYVGSAVYYWGRVKFVNDIVSLKITYNISSKVLRFEEGLLSFHITSSPSKYKLNDPVTLTASNGTGPYVWSYSTDGGSTYTTMSGATGASISIVAGSSVVYKCTDSEYKEATITIAGEVVLDCDDNHMTELFRDDFGKIYQYSSGYGDSKSKGRNTNAYTKYSYKGACTPIKNAGRYAVVADAKWGGCSDKSGHDYGDPCWCGDSNTGKWWFRTDEFYDHTQGGIDNQGYYGGMLLLNCADGSSSDNDILYERAATGLCKNTYTKFSVFVANAADPASTDPIKLKFILWDKDKTTKIAEKQVDGLKFDAGWQEVTAMFNSGDNEEVIVQVVNKAKSGDKGNDVLLDDVSFYACTPESFLYSDPINLREDTVFLCPQNNGASVERLRMKAVVSESTFTTPYYYWQKSDNGSTWSSVSVREGFGSAYSEYEITSGQCGYYRVIIAKDATDAQAVASGTISGVCGLYSITNSINVSCDNIEVSVESDPDFCKGEDKAVYTISVVNKLPYKVKDAKISCLIGETGGYTNARIENLTPSITSLSTTKRSDTDLDVSFVELPEYKSGEAEQTVKFKYIATPTLASGAVTSYFYLGQAKGQTNPNPAVCPTVSKAQSIDPVSASCDKISLSLTSSVTAVCIGDDIQYTITLNNNRAVVTDAVTLDVTMPSTQTFVSCTGGTYNASTKTIAAGTVPASGSKTIVFVTKGSVAGSQAFAVAFAEDASSKKSVTVIVNALPAIASIPVVNNTKCVSPFNGSLSLNVTGGSGTGYSYSIDNGVTYTNQYQYTGLQSKSVIAKVKDSNGCVSEAKNAEVKDLSQAPETFNVTGGGAYCSNLSGVEVKLNGSQLGVTYTLKKDGVATGTSVEGTGSAISFGYQTVAAVYTVTAYNSTTGCSADMTGSASVVVYPSPSATITGSTAICKGDNTNITFTASGGTAPYSFVYNDGADHTLSNITASTQVEVSPNATTSYALKSVSDANGCQTTYSSKSASVTVNPVPTISIVVAPSCSEDLQSYSVVVSANGTVTCDKSATITKTGSNWLIKGIATGVDCMLTVTSTEGCINTLSITAPNCSCPSVTAPIGGVDNSYCAGSAKTALKVDAPAQGIRIDWYNAAVGGTKVATGASFVPDAAGSYYAEAVQEVSGCKSSTRTRVTLTENALPSATITGGATVCAGDASYKVVGSGATNFSWDGGAFTTSNSYHVNVTTPGTKTVTLQVKDANGCISPEVSKNVTVNANPTATISASETALCNGNSATLTFAIASGTPNYKIIYTDASEHTIEGITGVSKTMEVMPSSTQTYTLKRVEDANGCYSNITGQTATITVNPVPSIIANSLPSCAPDLLTYSINVTVSEGIVTCDKSATISHTGNNWTLSDIAKGQDCVLTVTTAAGCTETLDVPAPNCECPSIDAPTGATNNSYCAGSAKTPLSVSTPATGYEIKWFTTATGGSAIATGASFVPESAGTYYAEMVQTVSGCTSSTRSSATLVENPLPTSSISATSDVINCSTDGKTTLTAVTNAVHASYSWSTGGSLASITVTNDGDYTVKVTNNDNGCSATSSAKTVTKNITEPSSSISGGNKIDCTTTSVTLIANTNAANATYLWSTGETTNSISVSEGSDYTVKITDADNGCSKTSGSFHVDKDVNVPTATITSDGGSVVNCTVTKLTLTANTNISTVSYKWSTDATTESIEVSEGGSYTVTVKNTATGCEATSDAYVVTKNVTLPTSSISATSDVINCNIGSTTLTAVTDASNASYKWSTDATTSEITVTNGGDYTVKVTNNDNGCSATSSAKTVTKNITEPTASISGGNKIDCTTTSVTLIANTNATNATYKWSTDATTNSISVSEGGDYRVTITDADNGCSKTSDSFHVDEDVEKPSAPASLGDKEYCDQTTVPSLNVANPAFANYKVQWYNQNGDKVAEGTSYTPSEPAVGAKDTYYAEMLNTTTGCVSAQKTDVSITRLALPVAQITGADAVCQESPLQLTGSGADNYSWMGAAYTTNNKYDVPTAVAGTQTVTLKVRDQKGCESTQASKVVTVNEKPVLSYKAIDPATSTEMTAPYIITCNVPSIRFDLSGGNSYKWDDSNTSESRSFNDAGTHSVIAVSEFGCESDPVDVTLERDTQKPILTISSKDASGNDNTLLTCSVQDLTLKANISNPEQVSGITYKWTSVEGLASTENPIVVNAPDTYSVIATADNGCSSDKNSIKITQDIRIPVVDIDVPTDILTCSDGGKSITLTASADVTGCTFEWNNGVKGSVLVVSEAGEYSVKATGTNGCISTEKATTIIDKTETPVIEISKSAEFVTCESVVLTATSQSEGMTYVWSDNLSTEGANLTITEKGTYKVTGTNKYSCVGEASITVDENKIAPVVSIEPNTGILTCAEPTLSVAATETSGLTDVSYKWSNGVEGADNSFTEKGVYTVKATNNETACTSETSITVTENKQVPILDLKALDAVCLPATVDLSTAVVPTSKYDEIKYFFDKEGQQEMPSPIVDVDTKQIFYVQGYGVDGSGCEGQINSIEIVLKPNSSAPIVNDYDGCPTTTTKSLKDQVISDKTQLRFYDDDETLIPRSDIFDASVEKFEAVYYVSNTENGKCESERTPINVYVEGTIDFELRVSDDEIFAARDIVTLDVEPTKDVEITSYVWKKNGRDLATDVTEYSSMLYTDSKFDVTATGKCNSVTKSATVKTLWPTLITPQVGKNGSFARGLDIIVFNRFNEKVFQGNDGWDGTLNCNLAKWGEIATPGVYYYHLSLPDGSMHKGTIEVVKF